MAEAVITWREAARRLKDAPTAIRGAVIAQGWPVVKLGTAHILTETQFQILRRQWQNFQERAAS